MAKALLLYRFTSNWHQLTEITTYCDGFKLKGVSS